jgi:hypothetical protein
MRSQYMGLGEAGDEACVSSYVKTYRPGPTRVNRHRLPWVEEWYTGWFQKEGKRAFRVRRLRMIQVVQVIKGMGCSIRKGPKRAGMGKFHPRTA